MAVDCVGAAVSMPGVAPCRPRASGQREGERTEHRPLLRASCRRGSISRINVAPIVAGRRDLRLVVDPHARVRPVWVTGSRGRVAQADRVAQFLAGDGARVCRWGIWSFEYRLCLRICALHLEKVWPRDQSDPEAKRSTFPQTSGGKIRLPKLDGRSVCCEEQACQRRRG